MKEKIEEIICSWAGRSNFVVGERIWKSQLEMERSLTREVLPVRLNYQRRNSADDVKNLLDGALDSLTISVTDFMRFIYFPMGYIEYIFSSREKGVVLQSDSELEKHISLGSDYDVRLIWNLGHPLRNWNSPQCTMAERKENSLLNGLVYWDSSTNLIDIGKTYPEVSKQKKYRKNFFYQALSLLSYLDRGHVVNDESIETTTRRLLCLITRFHYVSKHPSELYGLDYRDEYTDEFTDFNR